ncbi:MAG: amidohydrolase family protein [Vicinamibacterales bacterium]
MLLDGRVFTADPAHPLVEALAVRGDRIVAVGTTAEVTALAGASTTRRSLGGRTVIPGLNDAHAPDPDLDAPGIAARSQALAAAGVTSMQWFAGTRPVADTARALVAADPAQRVRVFRMPRPGPDDETIDSRPHLPPQPTLRIDVRGMGFRLGAADQSRIDQAVHWAYGSEDLLAIEPADRAALAAYVEAVERGGLAEVWRSKRPRIEEPGLEAVDLASRIASLGMVVVARPAFSVPLASLVKAGVPLALGADGSLTPFDAVAWAISIERGAEALTVGQALTAFTRGSATAELSERDKGHLSVGALADLVVLDEDPFAGDAATVGRTRSLLTIIGGRVVHDVL